MPLWSENHVPAGVAMLSAEVSSVLSVRHMDARGPTITASRGFTLRLPKMKSIRSRSSALGAQQIFSAGSVGTSEG